MGRLCPFLSFSLASSFSLSISLSLSPSLSLSLPLLPLDWENCTWLKHALILETKRTTNKQKFERETAQQKNFFLRNQWTTSEFQIDSFFTTEPHRRAQRARIVNCSAGAEVGSSFQVHPVGKKRRGKKNRKKSRESSVCTFSLNPLLDESFSLSTASKLPPSRTFFRFPIRSTGSALCSSPAFYRKRVHQKRHPASILQLKNGARSRSPSGGGCRRRRRRPRCCSGGAPGHPRRCCPLCRGGASDESPSRRRGGARGASSG